MKIDKRSPLERYVVALETVASSPAGLSLSEIAAQCALPIATTHRLVQALQHAGLMTTSSNRRKSYQLGSRLLRLLHAGSDVAWVEIFIQPNLDRLADAFGETCYLTRLTGRHVVSIAWATPEKGLQSYVFPGHLMPAHASASAKAILAYQSEDFIHGILSEPLAKLAPETKIRPEDVKAEYVQVRKQGFATCFNEIEPGMGALAVPVPLANVGVIYSLGVSGFLERLNRRALSESIRMLQAAAESLSRSLRHASTKNIDEADPAGTFRGVNSSHKAERQPGKTRRRTSGIVR